MNMSIASEILRIETSVNIIKEKTATLGLSKPGGGTVSASDKIDVQAAAINLISKGTAVNTTLNSVTTAVSLPAGYYGTGSVVSVTSMSAPTIDLSSSAQTIECSDKLMTGNITIPSANVFRSGSSAPSNGFGNDGDLFLIV